MPKYDWNGNGKKDNFDHFIEMQVISEVSKDEIDDSLDTIDDFVDNDHLFEGKSENIENTIDYSINRQDISNQPITNKEGSFQSELKKNMKTPQQVKKETLEYEKKFALREAERILTKIKEYLMYNVKHGVYQTEDGVIYVSCTCDINRLYLRQQWYNNTTELRKDKEKLFLFRDPNLVYKSGYNCDIKPDYRNEYHYFITALEELASKEKISIETVIVNNDKLFPFPGNVDTVSGYLKLCVKATTIISGDSSKKIKTVKQKQINESAAQQKRLQEQNSENWAMTGKCVLVIGIIILAFIICLNADIGPLGMALLLIGSVVLGCILLMRGSK